jgi:hypothetical protein
MNFVDTLENWLLTLDPPFAFLFAMPYFIAAAASLADWAESHLASLGRAASVDAALESEGTGNKATVERHKLRRSQFFARWRKR